MPKEIVPEPDWVPVPDAVFNARNYFDGGKKVFDNPIHEGDHGKSHRFNEETGWNELFTAADLDSPQTLSNKRLVDSVLELEGDELRLAGRSLVVGGLRFYSAEELEPLFQKRVEVLDNFMDALSTAPTGSILMKGVGTEIGVVDPPEGSLKVFSDNGWVDFPVSAEAVAALIERVEALSAEVVALKTSLSVAENIVDIRKAGLGK